MKDYPALHSESNLIDSEERLRTTLYNKRDELSIYIEKHSSSLHMEY
jgi:hypothetical protein